jgi:hypothetical protein
VAFDSIQTLQYKLRMMGVLAEEATNAMTHPESTLKKKHIAINYHQCCESIAWINGTENLADALTKVTVGEQR